MVNRLLDIGVLPEEIRLLEVRRTAQRLHQLVRERRWMMASEAEASINETEERMFLRILLAVEDQGWSG